MPIKQQIAAKRINFRWYAFKHDWLTFRSTIGLLRQQTELEQLEQWAKHKRLTGVRDHYRRLLHDSDQRLWRYRIRSPRRW